MFIDTGVVISTGVIIDTGVVISTGVVIDTGFLISIGVVIDTGVAISTGVIIDTGVGRSTEPAYAVTLTSFLSTRSWQRFCRKLLVLENKTCGTEPRDCALATGFPKF